MPYKNPEDKRRWEQEHREERNARRRKQYLAPRTAPTVQKLVHDPNSGEETRTGWKVVREVGSFALVVGIALLAAWGGASGDSGIS
jgi:hypothetical protein